VKLTWSHVDFLSGSTTVAMSKPGLTRTMPMNSAVITKAGGDAAILDDVSWHSCRHLFASPLVAKGVDLRSVQVLGDRASLVTVQRYAHMAPSHSARAVELLAAAPASEPITAPEQA
jgi:site-specific recombinase XerD